ncbi:GGDEF domain-containing protein [Parvibaculum sp.]|uniref:GGDEF domain-containing protein n=1 Tax=Parvibaculum sp. TaxID=2024848 RepID=UPI003210DCE6
MNQIVFDKVDERTIRNFQNRFLALLIFLVPLNAYRLYPVDLAAPVVQALTVALLFAVNNFARQRVFLVFLILLTLVNLVASFFGQRQELIAGAFMPLTCMTLYWHSDKSWIVAFLGSYFLLATGLNVYEWSLTRAPYDFYSMEFKFLLAVAAAGMVVYYLDYVHKQMNQKLVFVERNRDYYKNVAGMDYLTGLRNRSVLTELFDAAERRFNSVVLVDLDDFKSINDLYGHATGDDYLRSVADGLRKLENDDLIAGRLGGDEFLIIASCRNEAEVKALGRKVGDMIAAIRVPSAQNFTGSTASIGICFSLTEIDLLDAIKVADKEMYEHKKARANQQLRMQIY